MTPAAWARAIRSSRVRLVISTTGQPASWVTAAATSTPSPSGNPTAAMTTSGRDCITIAMASAQRAASPATSPPADHTAAPTRAAPPAPPPPADPTAPRIAARERSWSSTIATRHRGVFFGATVAMPFAVARPMPDLPPAISWTYGAGNAGALPASLASRLVCHFRRHGRGSPAQGIGDDLRNGVERAPAKPRPARTSRETSLRAPASWSPRGPSACSSRMTGPARPGSAPGSPDRHRVARLEEHPRDGKDDHDVGQRADDLRGELTGVAIENSALRSVRVHGVPRLDRLT